MAQNPYQNIPGWDPRTGMPRKKKQAPITGSLAGFGGGGGVSSGPNSTGYFAPGGDRGPINLPGFTPNYEELIRGALGPLNAQLGAEGSADVTSRNAALIRGIGQFGEQFDPASAQAAFGQDFYNQAGLEGLLPQANALAAQNTAGGFSVSSKLKSALEKSVQQIQDALAARGLLRSGATGTALQGAQKEYETGQYDARQSLTDYLSSAQQGFVAGERARQQQLIEAQRTEAERQARLNPPQGTQELQYSGKNAEDGRPLYMGPGGQLVYADGTPYTPGAAADTSSPVGGMPPVVTPPTATPPGGGGDGGAHIGSGGKAGGSADWLTPSMMGHGAAENFQALLRRNPEYAQMLGLQNMLNPGPASKIRGYGGAQNPDEILRNFLAGR